METLQIKKVDAVKAFQQATKDGKTMLSNLFGKKVLYEKITDIIHSWEDVCEYKGIDPVSSLPYPSPANAHQEYINAQHVLAISIEVLNEDWVADYKDPNQDKYEPRFIHKPGFGLSLDVYVYWRSLSNCGPRLVFRSPEILYHCVEYFMSWYKKIHSH